MPVDAHGDPVDHGMFEVGICGRRLEHPVEDPAPRPAPEPLERTFQ